MEAARLDNERIARARQVGAGAGFVGKSDFGPPVRLLRKEIEPEHRTDPDPEVGPLLLGGRVRDGVRAMKSRNLLTEMQWHAVCAFRDDTEIASGARPEQPDRLAGIRSQYTGSMWPEDAQILALGRVRRVWALIPMDLHMLTAWVVIGGRTLDEYAHACRTRRAGVGAMFQDVLEVIEARYLEETRV